MLQQTRVAAVLGYYDRFLAALPTVEALAAAPEEQLMKLWEGLGYYSRARNLQKAAKRIAAGGGQFPDTYEGLLALPGIGDYTASAIASAAFGKREAAVDGNVLRLVMRLTDGHDDIADPRVKKAVRAQVQAVMPETAADIRIFNQATMELGATVCAPNGPPRCMECPARDLCLGRLRGTAEELPVKGAKKPPPDRGADRVPAGAAGPHRAAEAARDRSAGGPVGVPQCGGRPGRGRRRRGGVRLGPGAQGLGEPPGGEAHLHPCGVAHDRLHPGGAGEGPADFVWVDRAELEGRAVPSAFGRYYTEAERRLKEG